MLPFYTFNFGLMLAFAIVFFRGGRFEDGAGVPTGLFWAMLSLLVSLVIWQGFGLGIAAMIIGQVMLFVAIGTVRAVRGS